MAQMFALSTLNTWNNNGTTGWSNTSGGAANGSRPDSSTDVVFDGNSGTARNINFSDGLSSGFIPCKTITTASAAALTFNNQAVPLQPYGNVNLTGSSATCAIVWGVSGSFSLASGSSTFLSVDMGSATTITLSNDLSVSTTLTVPASFNANNFNVTTASFIGSGSGTLTLGSGTWSLTGTSGTPWTQGASMTVSAGSSTIKFTGSGSSSKTFSGQGKTFNNFWNATTGAGVCIVDGSNTFNNFKIDAGRTQQFVSGTSNTVTTMTVDGTGNQITISAVTAASNAGLVKAGGGSIYVDRCNIQDIHATPSTTWYARNSTDVSGNTGITFIPGNSSFLQFF